MTSAPRTAPAGMLSGATATTITAAIAPATVSTVCVLFFRFRHQASSESSTLMVSSPMFHASVS
ncbi:hypothetical protein [Actinoplanes philippinensis]|nr:hypothetical protein [Actinoplanes philippinensis]